MVYSNANLSNYFTLDGLPWLFCAWICIYIFRPFATFIHEIGHAFIAWILTKEQIQLKVGYGKQFFSCRINRIKIYFSLHNMVIGSTGFCDSNLSPLKTIIILLAGPLFSASAAYLGIFLNSQIHPNILLDAISVGWICSHGLCFIRNLIPLYLEGRQGDQNKVPSDGLQIYKILKESFK